MLTNRHLRSRQKLEMKQSVMRLDFLRIKATIIMNIKSVSISVEQKEAEEDFFFFNYLSIMEGPFLIKQP